MKILFLLLICINCNFRCEVHNNCENCIGDINDCYWLQSYTGDFICSENEDEGVFALSECPVETSTAFYDLSVLKTPTATTTAKNDNGLNMYHRDTLGPTAEFPSSTSKTTIIEEEYSGKPISLKRHLRASPEISFRNLSRRMTKRTQRNFCHSIRLLKRVNEGTNSTAMNYFLKRNPMLNEAELCEDLIECNRFERQLGFGQFALPLIADCHNIFTCDNCVKQDCIWLMTNKSWCGFLTDDIPSKATFSPGGQAWCPASPEPAESTNVNFYFYGFWIQWILIIFALGFLGGRMYKKRRPLVADEAIPLHPMN